MGKQLQYSRWNYWGQNLDSSHKMKGTASCIRDKGAENREYFSEYSDIPNFAELNAGHKAGLQ